MSHFNSPTTTVGVGVQEHAGSISRRLALSVLLPLVGILAWAYGVSQLHPLPTAGYGLLASANVWFVLGIAMVIGGFVLEVTRPAPRGWLLALDVVGLIFAIHATVPLIYHTPEYPWVYKHLGIAAAFARYGHLNDLTNIYDQWPALFALVAAVGQLGHFNPLSFATWAPLTFELADALLIIVVFRALGVSRRVAWIAVVLYTGFVAWVGQDYLSPQAFSYLLWLGMVAIMLRYLRRPLPEGEPSGRIARLRGRLLAGAAPVPETSRRMRTTAVVVLLVLYVAIVATHQLTPYVIIAAVGGLTLLDLIKPRWLVLALAAIAGGYLAPRYHLISSDFGGLLSGGNPVSNASGSQGTYHAGAEATTATIVRGLSAAMWLLTVAVVLLRHKSLGRVAIGAILAFSPFVILGAQSYGGEAIYRVFLFSAPWCAVLIADALTDVRWATARRPLVAVACAAAIFAGVQGLYGAVASNAFTSGELAASQWVYHHSPEGGLIVIPQDNFPARLVANYNDYDLQVMPSDPQLGEDWLDEGDVGEVRKWLAAQGHRAAFLVVTRSMSAASTYYGAPRGFYQLLDSIPRQLRGTVAYRNRDAIVYRLTITPSKSS